uniref:GSKIP domain-containing protein n=1 Tax=Meloidogyne floridensis TaxID=298350 RepID=A0A915P8A5_9BILA
MTATTSSSSTSSPTFLDGIFRNRQSRGECISPLELEAIVAVQQFAVFVESIAVSEMLPRTPELIFVNLTTLEGQPHCLELTSKGWRVTSLRTDCMHGDFTKMEMFTNYYNSFNELMNFISPKYSNLKENEEGEYINNNTFHHNSTECSSNSISDSEELFSSNNSL